MADDKKHGLYSIGVVARLTGLHEQTKHTQPRLVSQGIQRFDCSN